MSKEQVIKEIIKICCEIGEDNISLMLAIADAESTLGQAEGIYDNIATNKNPRGIYQIRADYIENYNTNTNIKNSFTMTLPLRANLRSSIICVYETNIFYKKYWKEHFNTEIENYLLYIAHKQYVGSARILYNNRDAEIRKYNESHNILGNSKSKWGLTLNHKISDYLKCWEDDINEKVENYKDRNCKELETETPFTPLEPYKPEIPDWQQLDKLKVEPKPTLLEQKEQQKKMDDEFSNNLGNIAPATLESYKSPGPNYKSNRHINNTKFNVDKQLIPIG